MRRSRCITLSILLALGACGGHAELHTAQTSVYDIDFAIVYGQAMDAVQKLYPNFQEDAAKGVIRTSWHQVPYANTSGEDPAVRGQYMGNPMGTGPMANPVGGTTGGLGTTQTTQMLTKKYFVRFDVAIVGGRPWRVHVTGHAAEWDPGNAIPTELHGANTPHWLAGRTDELVVAIYERLQPYAVPAKVEEEKHDETDRPIDTTVFGAIPPDASKAAAAVERAVERRDYEALRAAVADDVVWSLGAEPGADAALAMWQADPSTLDALVAAMKAGCGGSADAKKVVCPAKAAADGYLGWRATFEPRGAAWKLSAFVKIE